MPKANDVQYEVVDKDGKTHGPFDTPGTAVQWAIDQWPDQNLDEDRSGRGWDVQVVVS